MSLMYLHVHGRGSFVYRTKNRLTRSTLIKEACLLDHILSSDVSDD